MSGKTSKIFFSQDKPVSDVGVGTLALLNTKQRRCLRYTNYKFKTAGTYYIQFEENKINDSSVKLR
jgi:hypothetical protein